MVRSVELCALSSETGFPADRVQSILGKLEERGVVTILDRRAVLGPRHLASGYLNAARAMIDGKARARAASLEILRWVAGSHQVAEALLRAGPDGETTDILIAIAPHDWPARIDRNEYPIFIRSEGLPGIEQDDIVDETGSLDPDRFGSPEAPSRLGVPVDDDVGDHERELAVLEWVATTELR